MVGGGRGDQYSDLQAHHTASRPPAASPVTLMLTGAPTLVDELHLIFDRIDETSMICVQASCRLSCRAVIQPV